MDNSDQQPSAPASSGELKPDMLLGGGRFRLKRILGQGGMGLVWLAHDLRLQEPVALKFLPPQVALDATTLLNLRRETLRSRKLSHPNIIRIHDFIDAKDEPPFISMEYVDGPNLHEYRERRPLKVLKWEFLAPLVRQLCSALDYAHTQNIIHRDLKPANLMLDSAGRLRLADFGLARVTAGGVTQATGVTMPGGTLDFMSPQQADGKSAQVADDIYSLGATLYELLTSRPPFYQGDIAYQLRNTRPDAMVQRLLDLGLTNHIPSDVSALVMACLAKEPERRPSSAKAILEFLESAEKEREKTRLAEPPKTPSPGKVQISMEPAPAAPEPPRRENLARAPLDAPANPRPSPAEAGTASPEEAPVPVYDKQPEFAQTADATSVESEVLEPETPLLRTVTWVWLCMVAAIGSFLGGMHVGIRYGENGGAPGTNVVVTTSTDTGTQIPAPSPPEEVQKPVSVPPPVTGSERVSVVYHPYDAFYKPPLNPSGPWSFGWKQNLQGPYFLLPTYLHPVSENGVALQGWGLTSSDPPAVLCNTSAAVSTAGNGTAACPNNSLWFTPGLDGRPYNFGVVRFTAPEGGEGSYLISGTARSFWSSVWRINNQRSGSQDLSAPFIGDSDFHVLVNGVQMMGRFLTPHTGASHSSTVYLRAGETVDFVIGRGLDGKYHGACLFLEATVSKLETKPAGQ